MDGKGFVQQGRNKVNWGAVAKVGDIDARKRKELREKRGIQDF
jgi:hypothetical protein